MRLKQVTQLSPQLFVCLSRVVLHGERAELQTQYDREDIKKCRALIMKALKGEKPLINVLHTLPVSERDNLEWAWNNVRYSVGEIKLPELRMMDLYPIALACGCSGILIQDSVKRSPLSLNHLVARQQISPAHEQSIVACFPVIEEKIFEETRRLGSKAGRYDLLEAENDTLEEKLRLCTIANEELHNNLHGAAEEREASIKLKAEVVQLNNDLNTCSLRFEQVREKLDVTEEARLKILGHLENMAKELRVQLSENVALGQKLTLAEKDVTSYRNLNDRQEGSITLLKEIIISIIESI